jgi:superfamily II DNA/RNA helicase
MGFMPQVEWLLRHVEGRRQTMLFSATLDGDVDRLIARYMRNPVRHEVVSARQTVHSMSHHFMAVHQLDKPKVVAAISRGAFRTLVFVRTKRGADRLTAQLQREGIPAEALHGDLRQRARERALAQFAAGKASALVATDVAARGLDVEGIDVVVHYDPPEDHKGYLHRSGRTARAGEAGVAVTLVLWNQVLEVERLQKQLGLRRPLVEVFSNDARLTDLSRFGSAEAEAGAVA